MDRSRILLVEDVSGQAMILLKLMNRLGYSELLSSGDVFEAWSLLCSGRFDLLILDMELPYAGGLSLLFKLRDTEHLKSTKSRDLYSGQ